jgi:hypothetical protein
MTQTPQHTPRPWHVEEPDEKGHVVIADEQDVSICRCYQQPHDTWTAAANAALIVGAVNTRELLLGALKKSQFALDSVVHLTGNKDLLPYIKICSDAIAAAEAAD